MSSNPNSSSASAGCVLVKRHLFGINCDFNDNLLFLDDHILIYAAARNIIFYNLKEHSQKFVIGSAPSTENWLSDPQIACIALSLPTIITKFNKHKNNTANNCRYLAIAEKGEKPRINIINSETLQRYNLIGIPTKIRSKELINMSFSEDNTHLSVQCGSPDWKLCIFDWHTTMLVHCITTSQELSTPIKMIKFQNQNQTFYNENNNTRNNQTLYNNSLAICNEKNIQIYCHKFKRHPPLSPQSNSNSNSRASQTVNELSTESIEIYPYEMDADCKWTCVFWLNSLSAVVASPASLLICGNSNGDVILLKDHKFEEVIFSKQNKCAISCITNISHSNMIIIASDDAQLCFLQHSIEESENSITNWTMIANIQIQPVSLGANNESSLEQNDDDNEHKNSGSSGANNKRVVPIGLSVDPSEEQLLISTSDQQIYAIDISNLSLSNNSNPNPNRETHNNNNNNSNSASSSSVNEELEQSICQPLGHFHLQPITGMDTCVRKPWLVTCSLDGSICIWNYLTKKLEIIKYFHEQIHSISFHPSGLHLLAGFTNKLKLLNVLMDDLRIYKEFHIIRNCHECHFSNGGHQFAVVNGDKIHVYNTYSCELIIILRGHNQKINSLYWSLDDTTLISAGAEGAVYQWSMLKRPNSNSNNFMRLQEHVNRQSPLNSAIITRDEKIYCSGQLGTLNEIIDSNLEKEIELKSGLICQRLLIGHLPQRMMFAGMNNGLVRSLKIPITNDHHQHQQQAAQAPHLDYVSHLGRITRLSISADDRFLFTAGEDACINIYEIRENQARSAVTGTATAISTSNNSNIRGHSHLHNDEPNWSNEILVTSSYLFDKQQLSSDLSNKVDELRLHNEYQLRLREMHYQDTLKEKSEQFNHELQQEKQKYEILKDEQQDLEMEYEEKIKLQEEQHTQQIEQLESFYQNELMNEIELYAKLEHQLDDEQREWEQTSINCDEEHGQKMEILQDSYELKLEQELTKKQRLEHEHSLLIKEYQETKTQLGEDFDTEISELTDKYHTIVNEERESTLRLKGENGVMKKKFTTLQNQIEDQSEESRKMQLSEQQFEKTNRQLKQEIENLDTEMSNHDLMIGEKEKLIYELKKRNQNLEKHKFVLDYKIKSLKKQIEPRQTKIVEMKDDVKLADVSLEEMHLMNGQLKTQMGSFEESILKLKSQIKRSKTNGNRLQCIFDRFGYDLANCLQFIQDPQQLNAEFQRIYAERDELFEVSSESSQVSKQVVEEYSRQKKHLSLCIASLKQKLQQQSELNLKQNMSIMNENKAYMKEIHQLREQLRLIQNQITTATARNSRKSTRATSASSTKSKSKNKNKNNQIVDQQMKQIDDLNQEIQMLKQQKLNALK